MRDVQPKKRGRDEGLAARAVKALFSGTGVIGNERQKIRIE